MEKIHQIIILINSYLWGPAMLVLLFGTHIFLTLRLKFIQRFLGTALKISFTKDASGEGDISHFGSLSTALAATIGTGNIVGVASAIALGGPGAVLWMWLTGVFGIATKYSEALLSVKYREKTDRGTMLGGPMYVLEKGLNMKWLGILFAIFTVIASFGIGNMVQSNSIASLVKETFHLNPSITGMIIAVLTGIVILGGIKIIADVCMFLVPIMAITYIGGCLVIIGLNHAFVLSALKLIVQDAFSGTAIIGGIVGQGVLMTMRYGMARGLFSNESGMGSAPIIAAAARTKNPVRQALVSATGTFWDTVVICAMTGLVLITSLLRNPSHFSKGIQGAQLTKIAFTQIPYIGPFLLTLGLLTFVFSTILGWSYYGERALEYLIGKTAIIPYRLVWVVAVYVGAIASLPIVWDFADAMNAMMAIPNLVSLLLLSGVLVSETRKYLWEKKLETGESS